jgi:ribonuclease P protein component
LKVRADFLRAAQGRRRRATSLTLEVCPTPEPQRRTNTARFGVTASRKVGGAVQRNRAKRRLREAARAVLPLSGVPGNDYVLVARRDTLTTTFDVLVSDLARAVRAVHAGAKLSPRLDREKILDQENKA